MNKAYNNFQDDVQKDKTISYIKNHLDPIIEVLNPAPSQNSDKECVYDHGGALAINARFGMGKTFFCTRYSQYLQESGNYNSVVLNAFLYDYQSEPLILISQILCNVPDETTKKNLELKKSIQTTSRSLWKAIKCFIPSQFGDLGDETLNHIFCENTQSLEDTIKEYKLALQKLAKKKPIVIFIDELDRCKPDFVLLFLERLKHYFYDIPGLLFVLMINQSRLEEIIKHSYAIDNPREYLEKFLCHNSIDLHTENNQTYLNNPNHPDIKYLLLDKYLRNDIEKNVEEIFIKIQGSTINHSSPEDAIQKLAFWAKTMHLTLRETIKLSERIKGKIKNKNFDLSNTHGDMGSTFTPYFLSLIVKYPDIAASLRKDLAQSHEQAWELLEKLLPQDSGIIHVMTVKLYHKAASGDSEAIKEARDRNMLTFYLNNKKDEDTAIRLREQLTRILEDSLK